MYMAFMHVTLMAIYNYYSAARHKEKQIISDSDPLSSKMNHKTSVHLWF